MRILGNMLQTLYAAAITALQNLVITTGSAFQVVAGGSVQIGASSSVSLSATTSMSLSAPSGATVTDATGTVWGAPTGGPQGAGTINVAGNLYVNGVAVATGGAGGVGSVTVVNKTSAQATTRSSVSLSADPQLVSASLPAGTYRVEIVGAMSSSNGTSGFQFNMAGGGATLNNAIGQATCFSSGLAFQGIDYNSSAGSTATFNSITAAGTIFKFAGEVVTTSTGTIGFQWTPQAAGSTTLGESHMVLTRIA